MSLVVLWGIGVYMMVMSAITFFLFAFDKIKSTIGGARRFRESTLLLLSFLGGSPGGLLAMSLFRHKTKKGSFQGAMIGIVALQAGGIALLLTYFTP